MRLARNLCVDIHREGDRGANRVENIEVYAEKEEQGLFSQEVLVLEADFMGWIELGKKCL
jgi:hypothetical protein